MFFDENGVLNLDEMIAQNDSFKKIMADELVSEAEVKEQSDRVLQMMHDMEQRYTVEQVEEIKHLLVETNVLYAIYNIHSLQTLKL